MSVGGTGSGTGSGSAKALSAMAPMGVAGLAVAGALAMAVGSALNPADPPSPSPSHSPTLTAPGPSSSPQAGPPSPHASGIGPGGPSAGGPGLPGVARDQAPGAGAGAPAGRSGAPQLGVEVVVKFRDDARVKEIVDLFWRDQAAARVRFEALKADMPEFNNLALDRVTYSNELVLAPTQALPAPQRLPAMREIAARLGKRPDIAYAEPNMTAHPGGHQ